MNGPALHIQTGHGGFTLPLTFQPLTIGRSPDNLVHLDDESVHPHHCVVLRIGDEVHILDLQSQVMKRLRPGEVVRVGHAQVRLAASRPQEPEPPPGNPGVIGADLGIQATSVESEPMVPVIAASELRETVTGKLDSGAPIKVVPDPEADRPPYLPPPRLLGELLLPRDMDGFVRGFLRRPAGMVIVSGPPGSGRTTTAYAMLRHLAAGKRKIVTFEQPPELQIEGAVQVFIHDVRDYGAQVEKLMVGTPNVLMLGEPPTLAAANSALRAAVGKCLVIAVVEALDTMTAIHRWLEMGVQPRTLASSLGLVLSQRIVRRLCDQCKLPVPIEGEAAKKLAPFAGHIEHIYAPDCCPNCNNTGFVGRIGVFEVLKMSDSLRATLMTHHPRVEDLKNATDSQHFIPLQLSAYARVAQGLTSMEEADRVAPSTMGGGATGQGSKG